MTETEQVQRLDKWLWHARFVKTRTLAQKLISGGGVRVNREKVTSTSFKLKTGSMLTLALPRGVQIIEVIDIAERRGSYPDACKLYNDLTPPPEAKSEEPVSASVEREKRPNREDRRKAILLKQNFPS